MGKKHLTNAELSRISQKWHCCPELLTAEEDALLPQVLEWERDINIVETPEPEEPSLETLYLVFYGVKLFDDYGD